MAAGESKRDPLAIGIAMVGLLAQCGLWFYWGGRIETRVDGVEKLVDKQEVRTREVEKHDAEQGSAIAVQTSQNTDVIRRLERIETKLDAKR